MFDATAAEAALTDRQRAVLDVIREYGSERGYPPTVREIGEQLGMASSSTVHSHLAALERAGIVRRDPTKPRALTWLDAPGDGEPPSVGAAVDSVEVEASEVVPILGRVAAGEPLLADQHLEGYLSVPKLLTRAGESFLLKVRGDSMVDAGILDGDYVVVRSQQSAHNGDIVVALVDGDATCKLWYRRDDTIELRPENELLEPIVRTEGVDLVGIVTGVMRAVG